MLSGSAMLYYVLDAQLFLKPRLVHYTENILLMVNCFFPLITRATTVFLTELRAKFVCESSTHQAYYVGNF